MESYRRDKVDVFVDSKVMGQIKLALIDKHFRDTGCAREIFSEHTDMVSVRPGGRYTTDNRYVTVTVYYNSNTLDSAAAPRAMCRHLVFKTKSADDDTEYAAEVARIGDYRLIMDEYESVTQQKTSEVLSGVVRRSRASTGIFQDSKLVVMGDSPFHIIQLDPTWVMDAINLDELTGPVRPYVRDYATCYCRQLTLKNARYAVDEAHKSKVAIHNEAALLEMAMFRFLFYMDYRIERKLQRDIFLRGYHGADLNWTRGTNENGHKIVTYIQKTVQEHFCPETHECNIIHF